jgi:cell division protein FtsL
MVSERAAVGRPGAVRTKSGVSAWRARWSGRPAIAGRERLAEALGQSVLVQLMLAMSFVALAALLYMVQASQVSVQRININTLRTEQMELAAANTNYDATAASLQSYTRIDAEATSQLQMAPSDPSTWVSLNPFVPRVVAIPSVTADTSSAQKASQPLAWMERAISLVRSSL